MTTGIQRGMQHGIRIRLQYLFMEEYHGTQEVPVQGNSVRPRDTVSTVMSGSNTYTSSGELLCTIQSRMSRSRIFELGDSAEGGELGQAST